MTKDRFLFVLLLSICSVFFFPVETGVSETGGILVIVDPGHGGIDSGAIGVDGLQEKKINLKIARLVSSISFLEAKYSRFKVILTRREDRYLAPSDRINMANEKKAHLFLSIHANHYRRSYVEGISTLCDLDPSRKCKLFAETVQRELIRNTGAKDRGVKEYDLYIRSAEMPAIIVEAGFISNPYEARKLTSLAYQKRIATSILDGINKFIISEL